MAPPRIMHRLTLQQRFLQPWRRHTRGSIVTATAITAAGGLGWWYNNAAPPPTVRSNFSSLTKTALTEGIRSSHDDDDETDESILHAADFDVYLTAPTAQDLPRLLQAFHAGKDVWPWIWTQPNGDGPHHVFVVTASAHNYCRSPPTSSTTKEDNNDNNAWTMPRLADEIKRLARDPQANVLFVTSLSMDQFQEKVPEDVWSQHCGIVTDANIALLNAESKLLMLDDERVISFDRLVIL